jgi:hypothetical protein
MPRGDVLLAKHGGMVPLGSSARSVQRIVSLRGTGTYRAGGCVKHFDSCPSIPRPFFFSLSDELVFVSCSSFSFHRGQDGGLDNAWTAETATWSHMKAFVQSAWAGTESQLIMMQGYTDGSERSVKQSTREQRAEGRKAEGGRGGLRHVPGVWSCFDPETRSHPTTPPPRPRPAIWHLHPTE